MAQTQQKKASSRKATEEAVGPVVPVSPQAAEEKAKRDAELDALLDEIDELVENGELVNATEYQQKGGE